MFNKLFLGLCLFVTNLVGSESKIFTLGINNFVSLVGPVSSNSVDDLIKSFNSKNILEYIQEEGKIILYINSPGGSVFAGTHLIQYINSLKESKIVVNCIGQNFMSMAFIIMQVCDNRYVMFNSIGMQHQMSISINGNIENFKNHFNLLERVNDKLTSIQINKIDMTKDEFKKNTLSDWWLYGHENVEEGVADKLVTIKCHPSIMYQKTKRVDSILNVDFTIELNKCPILVDVKIMDNSIQNISKLNKYYDSINYLFNVKEIVDKFKLN
jgi:ATP-dependent protease ClpP protease subunit